MRKKIAPLDVSVKSMYTIFPLFLKVMYRIWCHHLPYVRLQSIALKYLCQTFRILARFFQFLVLCDVADEEETNCVGYLNELFLF